MTAPKQYRDFTEILASLSESAQHQLAQFQHDLLELPEFGRKEFSLVLRATLKFIKRGKSRGFTTADLFQEGYAALLQANKVCQLVDATGRACYVSKAITRHVKRVLDGATPLYYPRQVRRDRTAVNRARRSIATRASRSTNGDRGDRSLQALSAETGLSTDRIRAVYAAEDVRIVPISELMETLGYLAEETQAEDPRLPVVQRELASLPERERRIVELHLGLVEIILEKDGKQFIKPPQSFAEVARVLGISKTTVQRLYAAAIGTIRSACNTTVH